MSGFFSMSIDKREFNALFEDLAPSARKAAANSLNSVGRKANTAIEKFIIQNYKIKRPSIKALAKIIRAHAKAGPGGGIFRIRILKKGRGLFKYGAEQVAKGTQYTVRAQTQMVKGGFISTWQKGSANQFVFVTRKRFGTVRRISKKGTAYEASKRKMLWGPSIASLFTSKKAVEIFRDMFDKLYESELDEQFVKIYEKS